MIAKYSNIADNCLHEQQASKDIGVGIWKAHARHPGVGTFHRPHPAKEAKPYQVKDARRFLEQAGVTP